jgi:hypothetical protein
MVGLRPVGGSGVRVAASGADSTPSHPEPGRARRQRRKVLRGQLRGRRGRRAHAQAPNPRLVGRRGVEQRQLVGLITQRSRVRIPPPLPVGKCLVGDPQGIFRLAEFCLLGLWKRMSKRQERQRQEEREDRHEDEVGSKDPSRQPIMRMGPRRDERDSPDYDYRAHHPAISEE